ncbi:hypothetical protein C922_02450 [Plasmodium inui San Antonio 1]|uniref:Uncharacterized protein n=1 Tax=Plasmodium inui San Antonio 1 TaxID=1237626 RepID=W7A678_9APIC|nr:hypothetical protein C922_02450 [Plasmodium inui San Antonio 1]EUD67300.1 hypothetical protein C922_02450 [Plasmodium inui San Antonio 1]
MHFSKSVFFFLTPKYHLQTQIRSTIKKKQNICFIKRKKRKEHRNYFKYGIAANREKGNSQQVPQLGENSQPRSGRPEGNQVINQNEETPRRTLFGENITQGRHTEWGRRPKVSLFHTKVIKQRGGANLRNAHLMGKIIRRSRQVETSIEQGRFPFCGRAPLHLEKKTKAHERGQADGEDTYAQEKGASRENNPNDANRSDANPNAANPNRQVGNHQPSSAHNNADHTNSSRKNDKLLSKKGDYYSCKDAEKPFEDKSHEKAEMNIKRHDLILVALSGCIPFICFGFVDNSFMIIAGDLFDSTFCVFLGFSTLAAAGLGNLTSDVLGIFIGGYIEKIIAYVGFPRINLTNKQLKMNRTRRYYYIGSARNLYSLVDSDIVRLPLDQDIIGHVYKSGKLINYESGSLMKNFAHSYKPSTEKEEVGKDLPPSGGTNGGTELFVPGQTPQEHRNNENSLHFLKNQDFYINSKKIDVHQVMAAPVFGLDESIIAVVVAINAKDKVSFTDKDAQFLSMFCSHISKELEDAKGLPDTLR